MDEGGGKRDENTPALMNPMTFFVADMNCSFGGSRFVRFLPEDGKIDLAGGGWVL
jgi:hypothetical protein